MQKEMMLLITLSLILTPVYALDDPFAQLPDDVSPTEIGWEGNYSQYYFGEDLITKNLKSDGAYTSGICVDTKKALATSIFLSISAIHNNNPDDMEKADKILKFLIQQKNKQGLYYYYKDEGTYKGVIPADDNLKKLYLYALAWDVMAHNYLEKMGLEESQYIATINNKKTDYILLFNTSEIIQLPQNISEETATQVLSDTTLPNGMFDPTSIVNYAQNLLDQMTQIPQTATDDGNTPANTTNITIYYFTKNNIINEYKNELENQKNQPYILSIIPKINSIQTEPVQNTDAGKFLTIFETTILSNLTLNYYPDDITELFQNPQYIALSPYYHMGFFEEEDEIENLIYKIYHINDFENNGIFEIKPKRGTIDDMYRYYTYYASHADIEDHLSTLYSSDAGEINKLEKWDKNDLALLLAVSSFQKDLRLTLQNNAQKLSNYIPSSTPIGKPNIEPEWEYSYTQKMLDDAEYLHLPAEVFVVGKKPKTLLNHYTIYGYDTPVILNNGKLYTFKTLKVKTSEMIYPPYAVNIYGLKNGTLIIYKANGESESRTITPNGVMPATVKLDTPPDSISKIIIEGYDWGGRHILNQVNLVKTNDGYYSIKPILLEDVDVNNTGSVVSYFMTYHPDLIYDLDDVKLSLYLKSIHSSVKVDDIEIFLTKELEQEYLLLHKQIITQLLKQKWSIINGSLSIPADLDEKENSLYITISHLNQLNKWHLNNNLNQYHQRYINLKTNPTLKNFENYVSAFEKRDLKDLWQDFWTVRDNIVLEQKIDTILNTGNLTLISIPPYANNKSLIITAETINNYSLAKSNREKAYIGKKLLTLIPSNTTLAKRVQEEGINSYLVELNSEEFRLISNFIHNNKNWNDTINKEGVKRILFIENEFQNLNKNYSKPALKHDIQLVDNAPENTKLITIAQKTKSYELNTWSENLISQYNKHLKYLQKLEEQRKLTEQKAKEKRNLIGLMIGVLLITILGAGIAIHLYKKSKSTYKVEEFDRENGILRIRVLKPTKELRVKVPEGWIGERMAVGHVVMESDYRPGDIVPIRLKRIGDKNLKSRFDFSPMPPAENNNTVEDNDDDDFDLPIEK